MNGQKKLSASGCAKRTLTGLLLCCLSASGFAEDTSDDGRKQQDSSGPTTRNHPDRVVATSSEKRVKYTTVSAGLASSRTSRFRNIPGGREHIRTENTSEGVEKEKDASTDCNKSGEAPKGNPINIATGNKIESELDFVSSGEMPLTLARTYNHHWYGIGLFGYNWLSSFDFRLSFGKGHIEEGVCYASPSVPECTDTSTASEVWIHRPDGGKVRFVKAADGVFYETKASPIAKIVRQSDGKWVLFGEDGQIETYSVGGYPVTIQNEAGVGWSFRYGGLNNTQLQEVTHTSGRSVLFLWVGDELREVRDPAGRAYLFTYRLQFGGGRHWLKTTTTPGSVATTITYHYTDEPGEAAGVSGALTGKSYNGARYSTFTYDASRNATSSEHAGGVERSSFVYTYKPDGTMSVVETNPLGKQATYVFKGGKVVNVTGLPSNSCAGAYRESTYDAYGYPDLVTDFNGHFTNYDYDAKGLLQKVVEAVGEPEERTTTYQWDATRNRVSRIAVEGLRQVDYTYTTGNRVASMLVTNLSTKGLPGQMLRTDYAYTQHPNGLLATATVDGPLTADTVTYTYSAAGDLTEVSNSLGHAVKYSGYNALGQVGRVTSANGAIADYSYDDQGRLARARTYPDGSTPADINYTYDAVGRMSSVQMPDGRRGVSEYDAAWRVTREYEQEPSGTYAVKKYTYNNASLVTSVVTERTTALNPPVTVTTLNAPGFGYNGAYTVSWSSVAGAEFYRIEEQAGSGGSWVLAYEGSSLNKPISGKPAGSYSYRGAACNAAGCSGTVGVWTVQVIYAPATAPSIAAPGQSTSGSYIVNWTSVAGAASYKLEESANGGAWTPIHDAAGNSKLVTGKNAGTYSYRVKACNVAGCGPLSGTVAVQEIDPPGAPPNIFAPSVNPDGNYTISWTAVSGSSSYQLEEYIPGGNWTAIFNGAGTSLWVSRSTAQTYYYQVRACNVAGCGAASGTIVVQPPVYGAQFVWQSIPTMMFMGDSAVVTVQMRNTGNTTWTAGQAYNLGSQTAQDNTRWGMGRVAVPGSVAPGQIATFTFAITAPSNVGEGLKVFHWRMVRDGVAWFGDQTTLAYISVASPGGGNPDPDPCGGRPNCHEN